MKIALLNKKGGVGKTPFAFSIAKDLDYFLQSNDNSCIEQIYPDKAKVLEKVKEIDNCVYDFGGFAAGGVLDIIRGCSVVIIPCLPTYNSLIRTIETIGEIKEVNSSIFLLATNFKDEKEEEFLEKELDSQYKEIPTFYFKNSKIVNNAVNFGLSFTELYNENSLSKRSYLGFYNEYRRLLKAIKNLDK